MHSTKPNKRAIDTNPHPSIIAATLTVIAATLIGCSQQSTQHPDTTSLAEQSQASTSIQIVDPDHQTSAALQLMKMAIAESETKNTPLQTKIQSPPGLDPESIQQRDPDDPKAFITLNQINRLPETTQSPTEPDNDTPTTSETDQKESTLLYLKARQQHLEGQYYESMNTLEEAEQLTPQKTPIPILQLLARNSLAAFGRAKALTYYERILLQNPDDTESLLQTGVAARQRNELDTAINKLLRIVQHENDPLTQKRVPRVGRSPRPSTGSGSFESHTRVPTDTLNPFKAYAAYELGKTLFESGHDTAGIEALEQAIITPDALRSMANLAPFDRELNRLARSTAQVLQSISDAHIRLGQYDQALTACEQATAHPGSDRAGILRRLVYIQLLQNHPYAAMLSVYRGITEPRLIETALELAQYLENQPNRHILGQALAELAPHQPENETALTLAAAALLTEKEGNALVLQHLTTAQKQNQHIRQQLIEWGEQHGGIPRAIELLLKYDPTPDPFNQSETAQQLVTRLTDPREINQLWNTIETPPLHPLGLTTLHLWMLIHGSQYEQAATLLQTIEPENKTHPATQLAEIKLNIQQGLINKAQQKLNTLINDENLETIPPSPHPILIQQTAELLTELGDISRAITILQSAVEIENDAQQTLQLTLAQTLINAGRTDKADALLTTILTQNPTLEKAHELYLDLYGPTGPLSDPQIFQSLVTEVAHHLPDSRLMQYLQTQSDLAHNRTETALDKLQELARKNPDDTRSTETLISEWIRLERYTEAENWLNEARQQRPSDRNLLEWLTWTLIADHRPDEAIIHLENWLEKRPLDETISKQYESALRTVGRTDEAQKATQNHLEKRPESFERTAQLAALAINNKQFDQALNLLHKATQQLPENPSFSVERALYLATTIVDAGYENPNDAYRFIEQTITEQQNLNHPTTSQSYTWFLDAKIRLDQPYEEVINALDKACADQPDDALRLTVISIVFLEAAQRTDDACQLMDRQLGSDRPLTSNDAPIASRRLETMAQRNEILPAINLIKRLGKSNLLNEVRSLNFTTGQTLSTAEALYNLSALFFAAGHNESTEPILIESLQVDPTFAPAGNDLGYLLADRGEQLDKAEQLILMAYHTEPQNVAYIDSLGWLRYKQGRFDSAGLEPKKRGAISLLTEAAEQSSGANDPVILDHLGDALWRAGQTADAIRSWKRVQSAYHDQIRMAQDIPQISITDIQNAYEKVAERAAEKVKAAEQNQQPQTAPCPALDQDIK